MLAVRLYLSRAQIEALEAIALAIESEHGRHHTAVIHSRNLDTIPRFGHGAGATLFVVNGPSLEARRRWPS